MSLSTRHPHERDERVAFDGPSHTYIVDGVHECRSVTTAIAGVFPAFDPDAAVKAMRGGRKWGPTHPMYGMSDDEIKAVWSEKGKRACDAGTSLHLLIEHALNQPAPVCPVTPHPDHPEMAAGFGQFMEHLGATRPSLVPYRTEWALFDKRNRLAGSVDAVFHDRTTDTYVLFDWKRAAAVPYENDWGRSAVGSGLAHLPDSKGARYALQLSMYAYLLETFYDIPISETWVVAIHPDIVGPTKYTMVEMPRLREEALRVATGAV